MVHGTGSIAGEVRKLPCDKGDTSHIVKRKKIGWLTYTEKSLEGKCDIQQLRIIIGFEEQNTMENPENDTSSKSWQMNWKET